MTGKTLDCSDIDRYLGKPMQPGRMRDSIAKNDIRRWAQGMHYPNRLRYDDDFAAESHFGGLVAPQSFPPANGAGSFTRIAPTAALHLPVISRS